jgi:putative ABC transport system substrate-binding protein
MRRRVLGSLAGAAALAAVGSVATLARPLTARRIYAVTWRGRTQVEQGFTDSLGKSGLPVEFTWRDAAQSTARIAEFAREIRETKPDLVYTGGTPPTLGIAGPFDQADPATHVTGIPSSSRSSPRRWAQCLLAQGQGRDGRGLPRGGHRLAGEAMRVPRVLEGGVIYNAATQLGGTASALKISRRQAIQVIEQAFDRGADGKPVPTGRGEDRGARPRVRWLYLGPDTYLFSQVERVAAAAGGFARSRRQGVIPAPILTGLVRLLHHRAVRRLQAEQISAGVRATFPSDARAIRSSCAWKSQVAGLRPSPSSTTPSSADRRRQEPTAIAVRQAREAVPSMDLRADGRRLALALDLEPPIFPMGRSGVRTGASR